MIINPDVVSESQAQLDLFSWSFHTEINIDLIVNLPTPMMEAWTWMHVYESWDLMILTDVNPFLQFLRLATFFTCGDKQSLLECTYLQI